MFVSDRAVYRVAGRHSSMTPEDVGRILRAQRDEPLLTGCIACPQGCGTRIYWALSASAARHKEAFLAFLSQQLCWTHCPDHERIAEPPAVRVERDWTYLPPASVVFGAGARYRNCYE